PFLPTFLKKFSVIFYLKALTPVDVPEVGPLSILISDATAPRPDLAVIGLLIVCVFLLWAAARSARKLEINYGE
ncbi:MAG: hypothetical protein ACRD96_09770, partial [Bryobacteraceae bacterium]